GARARVSVDHRDRVYRAVPRTAPWGRMRRDLRDLYLAGLEHDVQPVPVVPHRAGRADRGSTDVSAVRMAAVLAARGAAWHAAADLEHDDVGVGRLVLRRRLGGDHGVGPVDPVARDRILYR